MSPTRAPGRLRALAVTGKNRIPSAPDVPTIQESGIPGFDAVGWYALLLPPGTPREVAAKLTDTLNTVLNEPDTRAKLAKMGMEAAPGTPDALTTLIRSDSAKWSRVVQQTGIKLD